MKIYISGAITGTDDYMEQFAKAEKELTEQGYSVVNPAKVNAQLPEDTSYEEYMKLDILKASIIAEEEAINKAIIETNTLPFMNNIAGTRSSNIYYEMYNTDADKGLGIQKAIEYRKLNDRILVCIGDFENDLNMLKISDIALCPQNAIDEVKNICDKVLPDCRHNTIYHAIKSLK